MNQENITMINRYEELFEELKDKKKSTMLNLIYVFLISSDRVTDLESCNKSIDELHKMRQALEVCDLDDLVKEEWKKKIDMGLEICEKDKKEFINDMSHETE